MSEKQVRHVIRFPSDVYEKLRKIADKEDRSINSQVIAIIRQAIEQYEQQHGSIAQD